MNNQIRSTSALVYPEAAPAARINASPHASGVRHAVASTAIPCPRASRTSSSVSVPSPPMSPYAARMSASLLEIDLERAVARESLGRRLGFVGALLVSGQGDAQRLLQALVDAAALAPCGDGGEAPERGCERQQREEQEVRGEFEPEATQRYFRCSRSGRHLPMPLSGEVLGKKG